jgi:hypothetical protein
MAAGYQHTVSAIVFTNSTLNYGREGLLPHSIIPFHLADVGGGSADLKYASMVQFENLGDLSVGSDPDPGSKMISQKSTHWSSSCLRE